MLSLLRGMAATLRRQRVRRITVGELSALSDLALKDIGIDRGQIRSVVEELVQGTEPVQVLNAETREPSAYDGEHRLAA